MNRHLQFQPGPTGGAVIAVTSNHSDDQDNVAACVLSLLEDVSMEGLKGDFFIAMLQELKSVIEEGEHMYTATDESATWQASEVSQCEREVKFNKCMMTLTLLSAMCEHLGPSCLNSTTQILDFIKVTLERGVHIMKHTSDDMFVMFESESLLMALGLLTAVVGGARQLDQKDRESMLKLIPLLQQLSHDHVDAGIKQMASEIRITVATLGVVWPNKSPAAEAAFSAVFQELMKTKQEHQTKQENKTLIEELTQTHSSDEISSVQTDQLKSMFQQALDELCDPLVPVQGHALITLEKLIREKDPETLLNKEKLVFLFQQQVCHSDSYIYLSAINGLATLAGHLHEQVVPILSSEYANFDNKKRTPDVRLKLGEVLVKTSRSLGAILPKYRDVLLPSILSGCRSEDGLVRASSLSNLAEVCKLLNYSLGPVIQEVFTCCSSLLRYDSEVEVRRAAAHVLVQMIKGLGADGLKVLEDILRECYRLLKQAYEQETDEVVRLHSQLALEELGEITRNYLFPPQTLTKRIRVLDME